jgi:hypothetical protein
MDSWRNIRSASRPRAFIAAQAASRRADISAGVKWTGMAVLATTEELLTLSRGAGQGQQAQVAKPCDPGLACRATLNKALPLG